MRSLLTALLIWTSFWAIAQAELVIHGTITDSNGDPLHGASVLITEADSGDVVLLHTDSSGRYSSIHVPLRGDYMVSVSRHDKVTEHVLVNSKDISEDQTEAEIEISIFLFAMRETSATLRELLEIPVARSVWNKEKGKMGWDMEYTSKVQADLGQELERMKENPPNAFGPMGYDVWSLEEKWAVFPFIGEYHYANVWEPDTNETTIRFTSPYEFTITCQLSKSIEDEESGNVSTWFERMVVEGTWEFKSVDATLILYFKDPPPHWGDRVSFKCSIKRETVTMQKLE